MYIHFPPRPECFEWDPDKSEHTLAQRGFDFAYARRVFDAPYLVVTDARRDYGERRLIALGAVDGIELTVVFTDRVGTMGQVVRRIISARRSNRQERASYAKILNTTASDDASEEP